MPDAAPRVGVENMIGRLPKLYCVHCGRGVPRAAVHCIWCHRSLHDGGTSARRVSDAAKQEEKSPADGRDAEERR